MDEAASTSGVPSRLPHPAPRSTPFLIASVLFFLSGALGLGYELIWIRKASLLVGTSQIALATVVSSFFVGLSLGSHFVGRYLRSRRWSPLFVYGLFECAIGVFAFLFPLLFSLVEAAYGNLYGLIADSQATLLLVRFALLFALFLIPTFFMGGTLPLLLDGLVARDRAIGSLTSFLYGLNILGAVAGVLATAYFAIPMIGKNGASLLAGTGNLVIGIAALVAFRRTPVMHVPAEGSGRPVVAPLSFAAMSFVSGFVAIGYQVAWVRYFALFKTGSVYLTAQLLAVYLAALAVGSMALSRVLSRGVAPLRVLALVQPLIPVLVFAALGWWALADHRFLTLTPPVTFETIATWAFWSPEADTFLFAPLAQVALVVFLPVALIGTGLPALIAAAARTSEELRAISGNMVFWNTIGSSAGGVAAGYVLIPVLGLGNTFLVLGLLSICLGVASEWKLSVGAPSDARIARLPRLLTRPGYAGGALAAIAISFLARGDLAEWTIREYGDVRKIKDSQLVEVVEGPLTTAFVAETPDRTIIGSGNVCLAVAYKDIPSTQAIQGYIPALFHPRDDGPKTILGIALGSGQSFGALLRYPIERMDVVDISSEMIDLSLRRFAPFNHGLGSDPRVRFFLDDGRHFVERAADDSYDVVSMEPPPPTAEGVFSLYSLEFYEETRRILQENGVLTQWLPLYRVTPNDLRGIIKTQAKVFPNTFVMKVGSTDFVIVSFKSAAPPVFDTEKIEARAQVFEGERLIEGARWEPSCRYEIASLNGVLSLILTGPDQIREMEAPVIYRDDDERLSYTSGDRLLLWRFGSRMVARLAFTALPLTPFAELQKYFRQPIPVNELDDERARSLAVFGVPLAGNLAATRQRFERAEAPSERFEAALEMAVIWDQSFAKDEALTWLTAALESQPERPVGEQIRAVQTIVRRGIAFFHGQTRAWFESLPEEIHDSKLGRIVSAELRGYETREEWRARAYLWD